MTSEVEICNLALGNIRGGSINSLNESSVQAQQCKLRYPILRDRMLNEVPWQFNRKIRALASSTTEIFNWGYSYSYPVDCLKIHRMIGAFEELSSASASVIAREADSQLLPLKDIRSQIPYEVFNFSDTKLIGADEADLRIDFLAKVEDPNLFSSDFILALSHLLAAEIAVPVVGAEMGRALRSDSLSMYKQYLASAIASDMNDQYFTPSESEFITIRR